MTLLGLIESFQQNIFKPRGYNKISDENSAADKYHFQ